jgi:hypothetical protein
MAREFRDTNLALLIGLREHLEQAARLRDLLDQLLALARPTAAQSHARERDRRQARQEVGRAR